MPDRVVTSARRSEDSAQYVYANSILSLKRPMKNVSRIAWRRILLRHRRLKGRCADATTVISEELWQLVEPSFSRHVGTLTHTCEEAAR